MRSGALKLNQHQRIDAPLEAIDAQGQIVPNVRVEGESVGVSAVLRERIIERRLPVRARASGAGELPALEIRPENLLVRGPQLQIEKTKTLFCEIAPAELENQSSVRRRVVLPARVVAVESAFVTLQVLAAPVAPTETPSIAPLATPDAAAASTPLVNN